MQSLPQTDIGIIVRADDTARRRPEPSRAELSAGPLRRHVKK